MKTRKGFFSMVLKVILLLAAGTLQAQWSVAYLSQARDYISPVVAGDYVLFATGLTDEGGTDVVDMYNAVTKEWTVHHLPYISENYTSASEVVTLGGKVFFVQTDAPTDEVQVFDAALNSWSVLHLSEARGYISIGVAGDYVVFAGGLLESEDFTSTVDLYHVASGTWQVAHLSVPRAFIAITGLGDKIFMAGGYDTYTTLSDRVDVLNTTDGTTNTHTLVAARAVIEAVTVGNKVLLAGGGVIDDFDTYNEVDIYDGGTESWSSGTLVQYDFGGLLRGIVVGNKAYFQNGYGPAVLDVYDASSGVWSIVNLPTNHVLGAFTSSGNNLYLAGGVNDDYGVVERYDCLSGIWDTLGYLSEPRYRVCAAATGTQLLFAGGYSSGAVSSVVDIYTGIGSGAPVPLYDVLLSPYPNPTSGMLYIPLPADAAILHLFDGAGKLISTTSVENLPVKEIFTGNFDPGMYLISVEGKNKVYWAKFEVQ